MILQASNPTHPIHLGSLDHHNACLFKEILMFWTVTHFYVVKATEKILMSRTKDIYQPTVTNRQLKFYLCILKMDT